MGDFELRGKYGFSLKGYFKGKQQAVCVRVCACVCVCVCARAYKQVLLSIFPSELPFHFRTSLYTAISLLFRLQQDTDTHTHTHTYTHTHTPFLPSIAGRCSSRYKICSYTHTHTHTHMHACMHAHAHSHTCIHTYICVYDAHLFKCVYHTFFFQKQLSSFLFFFPLFLSFLSGGGPPAVLSRCGCCARSHVHLWRYI